ncbi:iron-siderophore ABC transporter substrate-binding protein [Nocardiopsis sediminis]|uniref:Iron-siderophore ABC transporter substrate-binding protein n=1 Tax=Nocardiopsis sediminis TaxID=1778267 RepID=A0ABV8FGT2_9ACTN
MTPSTPVPPAGRLPAGPRSGRPAALCAVLAALCAAAACGPGGAAPAAEGGTRTVEAANGTVEVPADPRRVAVLWRPTLAAATLLGADVVAAPGDPGAPGGGLAPFLPADPPEPGPEVVSDSPAENDIDIERLATTEPDLIIGVRTGNGLQAELLPRLEAIAPTVLLDWDGTASWRDHLTEVGAVLDRGARAEEAEAGYRAAVDQAREEIEAAAGDPAGIEVSLVRLQDEREIRLETPASFPGQVIADLGFARPATQRTAPDGTGTDYIAESYENLDRADGDIVFVLAGSGYADAPGTFTGGVWDELGAVRRERVFAADYDQWGASNHYAAHRIIDDVTGAVTGETAPAV